LFFLYALLPTQNSVSDAYSYAAFVNTMSLFETRTIFFTVNTAYISI